MWLRASRGRNNGVNIVQFPQPFGDATHSFRPHNPGHNKDALPPRILYFYLTFYWVLIPHDFDILSLACYP